MMNMFEKIKFTTLGDPQLDVAYDIYGDWEYESQTEIHIKLYNFGMFEPNIQRPHFPSDCEKENIILNYVKESINIEKKIGMIHENEKKGQFRLILGNFAPKLNTEPIIHYDQFFHHYRIIKKIIF